MDLEHWTPLLQLTGLATILGAGWALWLPLREAIRWLFDVSPPRFEDVDRLARRDRQADR